jgi:type IV secretory pathway VirJ component
MSLYEVLDLAINSLTFGSIIFFGSLFVVHSLSQSAAAVTAEAVEQHNNNTLPTSEDLFKQADEIIAQSVNPPISVEQADSHLDAQIAEMITAETAINQAPASSRDYAQSLAATPPLAAPQKQGHSTKKNKAPKASKTAHNPSERLLPSL